MYMYIYIYVYVYLLFTNIKPVDFNSVCSHDFPQTASGLIGGLARFLGRRQLPPRRRAPPTAQLQGVARLIPKNLALLGEGGWNMLEP